MGDRMKFEENEHWIESVWSLILFLAFAMLVAGVAYEAARLL